MSVPPKFVSVEEWEQFLRDNGAASLADYHKKMEDERKASQNKGGKK